MIQSWDHCVSLNPTVACSDAKSEASGGFSMQ